MRSPNVWDVIALGCYVNREIEKVRYLRRIHADPKRIRIQRLRARHVLQWVEEVLAPVLVHGWPPPAIIHWISDEEAIKRFHNKLALYRKEFEALKEL